MLSCFWERKLKKIVTGVVVVVAGAVLVLPKVIGSGSSKAYDDTIKQQVQEAFPGAVVETEKLEDGWFTSEGRHHIRISEEVLRERIPPTSLGEASESDGIEVVIDSKIHHGPIALTALGSRGGSFLPLAAVSESTFQLKSGQDTIDIPGKLYSRLGLGGGSGKIIYVVDQYQKDIKGSLIDVQAVDIEFDVDDEGKSVKGQGQVGSLSVKGAKGDSMLMKNLSMEADMDNTHGLWFGNSEMGLEQVGITNVKGQQFLFNSVTFKGGADGNEETFGATQVLKMGEITGPDIKLDDLTLEYGFENIDTQAMVRLQQVSRDDPTADPEAMMGEVKAMLARSPKFNINELSFKMPEGKVAADLHLSLPGDVDMEAFPFSLLQKLQGDGTVRIAEGAMPKLEEVSSGMSARLAQQGFLKKDGGEYVAQLKMQNGQFTINDKPLR